MASPGMVLLLCALSAAFFWRVILLRQALLPADILYSHDPLWGPLAPRPVPLPANPLDSDALTEFYPWTALAAGALHHGTLPLWNPYAFAGAPFLGAMQTAVLYPINLLLEWTLAPIDVLGARAAVHLAVTLVGTFLFARSLALSRPAALLSALSFGLGLPYVVWLEHPMAGAVAWLPWMLLCIEYLAAGRRRLWPLLGLAAVVALEMLSGHGESTAHALMLCGAYAIFRLALDIRRAGTVQVAAAPLALLAGGFALGTAIAAAHLLPALAQIPVSEAATDRTSALTGRLDILGDPTQWKTLVVALAPDFFGAPTWHVNALPLATGGYNELALYVGSVPLLLAALALWRARRAHTIFFGAAALVALGMAVRLPLVTLLDDLPVLRVAANGRLRVEYAFAVAVLAGYGLDKVVTVAGGRVAWRLLRVWLPGLSACAAAGISLLLAGRPDGQTVAPATAALVALPVVWLALFTAALWLHRRGWLAGATLRAIAPMLCALDLFSLGVGYHATTPRDAVASPPPAVRAIQGDRSLYRVAGLGPALWPSLSSLYGLQDVRGYDPAYPAAYEQYFAASFPGAGGMRLALAAAGPSPSAARALDLMNVKYIFSACDVALNARYYQPVYRAGTGCVYRNRSVMPRASIVHRAVWATPARAALLLGNGAVNPRSTVLLDPATLSQGIPSPPGPLSRTPERGKGVRGDEARVTSYSLNQVDVSVRSAASGVLVLSDAYAPGWRARVDGIPTALARADAVFRAVPIPAGTHRVSFMYEPDTFAVGARISIGAFALWATLLLCALGRSLALRSPRRSLS